MSGVPKLQGATQSANGWMDVETYDAASGNIYYPRLSDNADLDVHRHEIVLTEINREAMAGEKNDHIYAVVSLNKLSLNNLSADPRVREDQIREKFAVVGVAANDVTGLNSKQMFKATANAGFTIYTQCVATVIVDQNVCVGDFAEIGVPAYNAGDATSKIFLDKTKAVKTSPRATMVIRRMDPHNTATRLHAHLKMGVPPNYRMHLGIVHQKSVTWLQRCSGAHYQAMFGLGLTLLYSLVSNGIAVLDPRAIKDYILATGLMERAANDAPSHAMERALHTFANIAVQQNSQIDSNFLPHTGTYRSQLRNVEEIMVNSATQLGEVTHGYVQFQMQYCGGKFLSSAPAGATSDLCAFGCRVY